METINDKTSISMVKKQKPYELPAMECVVLKSDCPLCAASNTVDDMSVESEIELNSYFE